MYLCVYVSMYAHLPSGWTTRKSTVVKKHVFSKKESGLGCQNWNPGAHLQEDPYRFYLFFPRSFDHGENDEMLDHWIWRMSYDKTQWDSTCQPGKKEPLLILLWDLTTGATPPVQFGTASWWFHHWFTDLATKIDSKPYVTLQVPGICLA